MKLKINDLTSDELTVVVNVDLQEDELFVKGDVVEWKYSRFNKS